VNSLRSASFCSALAPESEIVSNESFLDRLAYDLLRELASEPKLHAVQLHITVSSLVDLPQRHELALPMSGRFAEDARTADAATVRADHLSLDGPSRFLGRCSISSSGGSNMKPVQPRSGKRLFRSRQASFTRQLPSKRAYCFARRFKGASKCLLSGRIAHRHCRFRCGRVTDAAVTGISKTYPIEFLDHCVDGLFRAELKRSFLRLVIGRIFVFIPL
jgi:hypothetical protein